MKNRIYFIYKYTFPNGKVYIGQTYKGSGRYGKPMKYKNSMVGNAMSKYPDFKKEIIEYCSKEQVDELERFYIRKYNSANRLYGYNRDFGGNEHKQLTDDLKKDLSRIHTDLQVTEIEQFSKQGEYIREWPSIKEASNSLKIERTQISKALHGHIKTAGGYIWKMKNTYSPYNSRPISQYDLKGNFIRDWSSVKEAEESLNIQNILNSLNMRNKTTGGFQWKYKDSSKEIKEYSQNRVYVGRHIYQYDLDGNFVRERKSYTEASKVLNIPQQHIVRVLKNQRKMTHGFIFRYEHLNQIEKYNADDKSFFRPVEQYSIDGTYLAEWPTIQSAEDSLKIKSGIGKCCRGTARTAGGFQWKYKGSQKEIKSLVKPKPIKVIKPRPLPANAKTIIKTDLNGVDIEEFRSIAAASKATELSVSTIHGCLKGKQKTAGGYKWRYK